MVILTHPSKSSPFSLNRDAETNEDGDIHVGEITARIARINPFKLTSVRVTTVTDLPVSSSYGC